MNYDPSNTFLAGEDPLELLERVKHRVVTMHASDRYLAEGTIEDLRKEEDSVGYAKRLRHGEIGQGMNDYDAIFRTLAERGLRRLDQHRRRRRRHRATRPQRAVPAAQDQRVLGLGLRMPGAADSRMARRASRQESWPSSAAQGGGSNDPLLAFKTFSISSADMPRWIISILSVASISSRCESR